MKKRLFAILMASVMCCSLAGCGSDSGESNTTQASSKSEEKETESKVIEKDTTSDDPSDDGEESSWAFYWYLCGSDLESGGGAATADLEELTSIELPDNVTFVIETGGASEWQNEQVDASKLQRYVYNSEGFNLVDEQELASMGDAATLESFLSYSKENYPADKECVIFWNHGGGSVTGAAFDENFENDYLSLSELSTAFSKVFDKDSLELVGFDTCLMATIDVANVFKDYSHYLVASEETEPGNGWAYDEWLSGLLEDLSIGGDGLGKIICDTFVSGCQKCGTEDEITLSCTDLTKVQALLDAYEELGNEALSGIQSNSSFITEFTKAAQKAENYGGNNDENGYTNMVDLADLVNNAKGIFPSTADKVLSALKDCIVYKINSKYKTKAAGLSCFFSYDSDSDNLKLYKQSGASNTMNLVYEYSVTGTINTAEIDLSEYGDFDFEEIDDYTGLSGTDWEGIEPQLNENNGSYIDLGEDAADILTTIMYELYLVTDDVTYSLGFDDDIDYDWENGIFADNFRGVWGAIDGNIVYMELSYEGEDYNLYTVPVYINNEKTNLSVAYDYASKEWIILGANKGISECGAADRDMYILKDGDVIKPIIHYIDENGNKSDFADDEIVYSSSTTFGEAPLPDGMYCVEYILVDAMGNEAKSSPVYYQAEDGELYMQ